MEELEACDIAETQASLDVQKNMVKQLQLQLESSKTEMATALGEVEPERLARDEALATCEQERAKLQEMYDMMLAEMQNVQSEMEVQRTGVDDERNTRATTERVLQSAQKHVLSSQTR